jgi:hypothetical protein
MTDGELEGDLLGRKATFPPFQAPWPTWRSDPPSQVLETWRWVIEADAENRRRPRIYLEVEGADAWTEHTNQEWSQLNAEHWRALARVLTSSTFKSYFAEWEMQHGSAPKDD